MVSRFGGLLGFIGLIEFYGLQGLGFWGFGFGV